MRLLRLDEHGKPAFTRDYAEHETPPYAILSHTWGADDKEVIYQDICGGDYATYSTKPGFAKVRFCGEQARKDGLEYFWVDSCCINKHNLTELAEAINSMFRWYKSSRKCYVFLSDISSQKRWADGVPNWEDAFRNSRWFKRGWTLQELLAPKAVEFFARNGSLLGSKSSLEDLLYAATGIPREVLRGCPLSEYPPKERFAWAAGRETKKREDKVYCLLGIFDVTLHITYGISHDDLLHDLNQKIKEKWDPLGLDCRPVRSTGRITAETAPKVAESVHHRQELMGSLEFEQMDARQASIKSAQRTTCEWLLQHQIYTSWQDSKHRPSGSEILWIKGKPGAGKSTLMKHILTHARKVKSDDDIIIHFFFNARGDDLEKTVLGMYRSLLLQLLQQVPDLQHVLDGCSPRMTWTVHALQSLLRAAIESLGSGHLKCFIDALDECNEQDVRDMVLFFEDVAESLREEDSCLSLCFASRHYPTISVRDGWQLILEDESGHDEDLSKYIKKHLRAARGVQKDELGEQLRTKANGVFMWAVLVTDILNKEIDAGRDYAVSKKLQQIPPKLGDLFKDILLRDQNKLKSLLLSMQWILFAKRPLTREEFYIAVAVQDEDWDAQPVKPEAMTRFVLNSSKGLAELTKSRKPTVQFIHESVRDFLLQDGGLREIWPLSDDTGSVQSQSHDQLKWCCHRYLELVLDHVQSDHPLPKAKSDEAKKLREDTTKQYPFLDYASHNVFYHANEAAQVIAQSAFVDNFPRAKWIQATNLLQQHDSRRHGVETTGLAYVFAENNFARLLKSTQSHNYWQRSTSTACLYPVLAALSGGHRESLKTMIQAESSTSSESLDELVKDPSFGKAFAIPKTEPILIWAGKTKNWALAEILVSSPADSTALSAVLGSTHSTAPKYAVQALEHAAYAGRPGLVYQLLDLYGNLITNDELLLEIRNAALCAAAEGGQLALMQRLLADGVSVDAMNPRGKSVICHAASCPADAVVRLLIDNDVNVNGQNSVSMVTALHAAAWSGHKAVLQVLIEAGADPHVQDRKGKTALYNAAENGHEAVVRVLIDAGADIETKDQDGETALYNAAQNGHEAVVRVLIEAGADPHAQNRNGGTALYWAAVNGHEAVVRVLIDAGAGIEAKGRDGETALYNAAGNGHEAVVRVLIDAGAGIEAKDRNGATALYWAASNGHEAVVRVLIDAGADIEAKGRYGATALHWAASNGHEAVVRVLIDAGADIEAKDRDGRTALYWAARNGHEAVVRLLIESGADVHIMDRDGDAVLSAAARKGHEAMVRLLLEVVASTVDIATGTKQLAQALHAAVWNGHVEITRLLIDNGADVDAADERDTAMNEAGKGYYSDFVSLLQGRGVNSKDCKDRGEAYDCFHKQGFKAAIQQLVSLGYKNEDLVYDLYNTPLLNAAEQGYERIVRLLLERGADVHARNRIGNTTLDVATHKCHEAIVRLLVDYGA